MAQAQTEVETMNQQTARYQQNVDTSKADICKIDPLPILFALQSTLQDPKVDVCLCERNPVCKCANTKKCTCDSDAFVDIHSVKMELASNCTFICEFMAARDKLNFLLSKNKHIRQSTIRIFTLSKDDNTERVCVDIVRSSDEYYMQLFVNDKKSFRFDIVDDIFVQEYVLVVKLNYMSMR